VGIRALRGGGFPSLLRGRRCAGLLRRGFLGRPPRGHPRRLLAEHGEERSLEEALLEELYSFVGESWEQEDDITLLTLRRAAASR
jgi:hypothetical protein